MTKEELILIGNWKTPSASDDDCSVLSLIMVLMRPKTRCSDIIEGDFSPYRLKEFSRTVAYGLQAQTFFYLKKDYVDSLTSACPLYSTKLLVKVTKATVKGGLIIRYCWYDSLCLGKQLHAEIDDHLVAGGHDPEINLCTFFLKPVCCGRCVSASYKYPAFSGPDK